jgi:hypothetical protein
MWRKKSRERNGCSWIGWSSGSTRANRLILFDALGTTVTGEVYLRRFPLETQRCRVVLEQHDEGSEILAITDRSEMVAVARLVLLSTVV